MARDKAGKEGRGHIIESQVKDCGFYPQYNEKPLKGFKQGDEIRIYLKKVTLAGMRKLEKEQQN